MALIKQIKDIISEILVKLKTTVIFQNKCNIVNGILKEICDILNDQHEQYQEQCQCLKQNLSELLKIIDGIQDEKQLLLLLNNDKPIKKFVFSINDIMENIDSTMHKMNIEGSFSILLGDLHDDLTNIDDTLIKAIIRYQKKRHEIHEIMKQIPSNISIGDNQSDENNIINELNKYPQYKLKRSDFEYDPNRIDFNDSFDYYNGTMNGQKVTILKLKNSSLFKRLLTVLITIDHPNVEKFLGACVDGNKVYMVTDRNGSNLTTVLDNQVDSEIISLQPGERTILAFKIAQAMSYLHSRSVMHRNLSTSNIIVTRKPNSEGLLEIEPIIVGFRNSRLIPNENIIGMSRLNITTRAPVSYFRAPEIDDGKYDEKVDVFAFSGILYQILTGHIPFEKENRNTVIKLLSSNERPPLDIEDPNLIDLIKGCWNNQPSDRFSFDQILFKMVEQKIIFPCDQIAKEKVLKFYEKNAIKNNKTKNCLKAFSSIKYYIGKTFQFRFEFIRAQSFLSSYEFQLKDSDYSSKEELTKEEADNINELYLNLITFQTIASDNSEEQWEANIELYKSKKNVKIETVEVIERITATLKDIYNSMNKLGLEDIEKYKENPYDLLFDIRELINYLPDEIYLSNYERIAQFMEEKKLEDNNNSEKSIQRRLEDLFSQFKRFELNPNELVEVEDSKIPGGVGATSKVYKKQYKGQIVAVKEFKNYVVNGERSLGHLRREMGYLTKLTHRYIAEFIGYVLFPENKIWIVSKYIKNGSLDKIIEKNCLSGNDKTKIAFKVALAMEFIHANNVIHLDLKPSNILIDDDQSPKITDFGFSAPNNIALNDKYCIGTYRFMAPEVYKLDINQDSTYNASADVFSFALTIWNLYSGKLPFDDLNDGKDAAQKLFDGVRCPFGDDISNSLKDLIIQAWDQDPNKRPTFEEIVNKMINQYIMFPGADKSEIKAFYNEESAKRAIIKLHFK